jgi:succinate dehydrogenase / fumarate reductase membrane anchor subunit
MTQATTSISASGPKSGENTWLWLVKLVTGPFILITILVHFIINHAISATGLLSYTDVVAYYQIWVVPIMEIIFLGLVVTHSLLGLRSIILDLHPSRSTLKALDWVFLIVGIVSFVYGTWLILVIVGQGKLI